MNDMEHPVIPEPTAVIQAVADVSAGRAVLLDVRRDDEYASIHAKGAVHWPLEKLEAGNMPDVPMSMHIYTYCVVGGRARRAKVLLQAKGWTDVDDIGGLIDWQKAGGEVE